MNALAVDSSEDCNWLYFSGNARGHSGIVCHARMTVQIGRTKLKLICFGALRTTDQRSFGLLTFPLGHQPAVLPPGADRGPAVHSDPVVRSNAPVGPENPMRAPLTALIQEGSEKEFTRFLGVEKSAPRPRASVCAIGIARANCRRVSRV